MNILHITSITHPEGNGVAVAVNNYIKYESKYENIALFNIEGDLQDKFCPNYNFCKYKTIKELPEPFCNPDLVVFNEVYKPEYIALYKECLKRNIKYIIIPHGCLNKYAQKKSKIKKIIGNLLLFNRFIYKANAIQFLNENERINSHFKYQNSIIAGNGVEKPSSQNKSNCQNKDLIFIGRYSINVKGLDLLADVCFKNHQWFIDNNIKLQLYGRDSGNELKKLMNLIQEKKVEDIIIINNPIYGEEKENLLKNSYAFIQCSRFEGQPMGIIEALSIGLPCIVTYGTSLGEYIEKNKCGISCNFNSNEVFNAIKKITEDIDLRNLFSKNSFQKTNVDFSWSVIIKNTLDEYKKI